MLYLLHNVLFFISLYFNNKIILVIEFLEMLHSSVIIGERGFKKFEVGLCGVNYQYQL